MLNISTYVAIAGAAFVLHALISAVTSPLRSVPGPFLARFTRLWWLARVYFGRFEVDNIELHRKYGPVVRYGPNEYSFSDPEAIKIIYGPGSNYDKSRWYDSFASSGPRSLFTRLGSKDHSQLKRKQTAVYSMSSLVTYESFVDETIRLFCARMGEIADSDSPRKFVDMAWWFLCFAADTISMISFSKRFGCLDKGEDQGEILEAMHRNNVYCALVGTYYQFHPLISKIIALVARLGLVKEGGRAMMVKFNQSAMAERRHTRAEGKSVAAPVNDEDAPKDFLDKFLDAHENDPNHFTETDMFAGLLSNLAAGTDSTAASLAAILYHLLRTPEALTKLREEIDTAWSNGSLSSPVTFKESQALPYLQAVIQEGLRMFPAVGLPMPRLVPPGGLHISGHFFPEGTSVGINAWSFHYNTEIFGDDAATFRPERWLVDDKEKVNNMQKYWMPFGLGSRTCIGKNISMLEMSKLLPEMLRRFDIELSPDLQKKDWKTTNYWFIAPESLETTVKRREQK